MPAGRRRTSRQLTSLADFRAYSREDDDKGAPDICAAAFTLDEPLRKERVQWEFIGIDCYCFF